VRTEYEFVLPKGYVDEAGAVHRRGVMRLATARDELEPLRDPTISGPDDPRLTIVVLSRVVQSLGTLPMVTRQEIEGLFAADLAYLQDFYGVINFGSDEDIDALLAAQAQRREQPARVDAQSPATTAPPGVGSQAGPSGVEGGGDAHSGGGAAVTHGGSDAGREDEPVRTVSRRHAIEEVPSSAR
jgi:hypothetical protein